MYVCVYMDVGKTIGKTVCVCRVGAPSKHDLFHVISNMFFIFETHAKTSYS